jgi:hypothetical protein
VCEMREDDDVRMVRHSSTWKWSTVKTKKANYQVHTHKTPPVVSFIERENKRALW